MAETVPKKPMKDYLGHLDLLKTIEKTYSQIRESCDQTENIVLSLPFFPKLGSTYMLRDLGLGGLPCDKVAAHNKASQSCFMSDSIINSHPRFPTFTKNVRLRR